MVPLKKRPWSGDPDDAGARQTSHRASEEGSAFDVDDDDESVDMMGLRSTFDLSPRPHTLDAQGVWVTKAKEISLTLVKGQKKEVSWWLTKKAGNFTLPHLAYSSRTGLHEFRISESVCSVMSAYLVDERNRDTNGFLYMNGKSWPGYVKYDLVHSELGCVSRLQEVRAHAHTDAPHPHPCHAGTHAHAHAHHGTYTVEDNPRAVQEERRPLALQRPGTC